MKRLAPISLALGLAASGALAAPSAPAPAPAVPAAPPVFRHALEQWAAGDYGVVVFHRGSMSDEAQALVDSLQAVRAQSGANATVQIVDVAAQMDKSMEDLWTGQNDPQPPWMVVRAPETSPDAAPVWTGPLTATTLKGLLDSPARRKISDGLLKGATAVWVLLECGEAARDEAAVDVLSATLKTLEKKMALGPSGPLRSPLPLHIDFDLVRVTRSDPAEEFFVTLLEHGKPAFSSRPVAYPVFGRGRTLGALVGREIDAEGIVAVCAMLTGAVRDGQTPSPGRDLLLAADWKAIFNPIVAAQPPAASVLATPQAVAVVTPAVPVEGRSSVWMIVLGVLVLGAGGLIFPPSPPVLIWSAPTWRSFFARRLVASICTGSAGILPARATSVMRFKLLFFEPAGKVPALPEDPF